MNDSEVVHGFTKYSQVHHSLPKTSNVIDLEIGELETTSADVLNQVIDDCGRFIDP